MIPTLDPSLDDSHDCSKDYDPRCVDGCAEPCGRGCNPGLDDDYDAYDAYDDGEPYCRYGVLTGDIKTGEVRAATGREAAHWARVMVRDGILPKDHPSVLHIKALRRKDHAVTAVWAIAGGLFGAGLGWTINGALTPTESGVLAALACLGYVLWLGCRK